MEESPCRHDAWRWGLSLNTRKDTMNYEAFEKIQKKVAEIQESITALCDAAGVPIAKHAAAISVLTLEIENLKSSLGGKKRRKRATAKATESKAARKKPGPKPKATPAT